MQEPSNKPKRSPLNSGAQAKDSQGANKASSPRPAYNHPNPGRRNAPRTSAKDEFLSKNGPVNSGSQPKKKFFPALAEGEGLEFGEQEQFVAGPNAVEALLDQRASQVHKLVLLRDSNNPKLYQLQKKAEKLKINCQQLPQNKLDFYTKNNQGVLAFCHQRPLDNWEEVKEDLLSREKALIVIASGIEDPRNLGACLRTAHALDVDAVLLPTKGGCGLTSAVAKSAAGALEKVVLCRPHPLESEVALLKEAGFFIVALDADGTESLYNVDFPAKTILITGGEDQGVPPYLRKQCHVVAEVPMRSDAHSLNTSVALSVGVYEFRRKWKI